MVRQQIKELTAIEFLEKGDFIANPSAREEESLQVRMYWDDFKECKQLVEDAENKGETLYVYTIIVDEEKLWIKEGWRLANRMGYLFSKVKVDFPDTYSIKYFS